MLFKFINPHYGSAVYGIRYIARDVGKQKDEVVETAVVYVSQDHP